MQVAKPVTASKSTAALPDFDDNDIFALPAKPAPRPGPASLTHQNICSIGGFDFVDVDVDVDVDVVLDVDVDVDVDDLRPHRRHCTERAACPRQSTATTTWSDLDELSLT